MAFDTVTSVLNTHWDGRLPVRPDLIAHDLGIEVRPLAPDLHGDATCGMADVGPDGRRVIYYNPSHPHSRIRFTLAHEMGHHLLNHTQYGRQFRDYGNSSTGSPVHEREANRFAAELLMPEEAIDTLVNHQRIYAITELASRFGVSEEAMYWRMKNLNYL